MAEIHDTLSQLLNRSKFREALVDAFHTGTASSQEFDRVDLADHIRHARGINIYNSPFEEVPEKIREVINTWVIDKLPSPHAITAEDLVSIAIAQLAGFPRAELVQNVEGGGAFWRFVMFALTEIEPLRTHKELLEFGDTECWLQYAVDTEDANRFEPGEGPWTDVLWESAAGFQLSSWVDHEYGNQLAVYGSLSGFCSENALDSAMAELKGLVKSIGRTVQLSFTRRESDSEIGAIFMSTHFAPISFLVEGEGWQILRTCLNAHFCEQNRKSDVMHQIAIAIRRIAEADEATSYGVALSQSFAAIEALVCQGTGDKTKTICSYVPTLLQPESLGRTEKGEILNRYYDMRSKLLHGSSVDVSQIASNVIRRVAAGVIRGIIAWRKFQEDAKLIKEVDTSWVGFLKDLKHACGDGKKLVGVDIDMTEMIPDEFVNSRGKV